MDRNIERILNEIAKDMKEVMTSVIIANDQYKDESFWRERSNLIRDMLVKISEGGDSVFASIIAYKYITWLDQGKPANKAHNPPPLTTEKLLDWAARRGVPIDNRTVWAVKRKIDNEGYQGKFFIGDFWIELDKRTEQYLDDLFKEIINETENYFNR